MQVQCPFDLIQLNAISPSLDHSIFASDIVEPLRGIPADHIARVVPTGVVAINEGGCILSRTVPVPAKNRRPADVEKPFLALSDLSALAIQYEGSAMGAREANWIR